MQIPTNFTVSPNNQYGDVYGTEFTFTLNLTSVYTSAIWNLGDGITVYSNQPVTHTYNYPGIYTVTLSAWTEDGVIQTDAADINVDYVYRDGILFSKIPRTYSTPGLPTKEAFTVSVTSAKVDQPLAIVLHSSNAKSVPYYSVPEKWRSITPTWRFLNAENNQIITDSLVLSAVPIYKGSKIVATSATASFYYIDDLPSNTDPTVTCPLLITATLSTQHFTYPPESLIYPYFSYSNNEVIRAALIWQVNDLLPTKLKVTENFLHDVYPTKWANVPIPVMITCETDSSKLINVANVKTSTNTILSYPRTNQIGLLSSVVLTLSSNTTPLIKDVHYTVEDNLYFKAFDDKNIISNGYIFTAITPLSPLNGTVVVAASTTVFNQIGATDPFVFPSGYPIYPEVYISHPAKGTINRISIAAYPDNCSDINYYKDLEILTEGSISFTDVPVITSTDLINYTLSGTAAVYGMAFNPIKDRLYTCDADQNLVSIYSSGTTLLTSIQLSSILGSETLAPSHITIDEQDNIWISLFDGHKLIKLDSELNYLLSAAPIIEFSEETDVGLLSLDSEEAGFVLQENSDFISLDTLAQEDMSNSPPVVEADMESNIWACYPDLTRSMLVKFDSEGNELFKPSLFPADAYPVSLAINASNGVWVACKNTQSIMHFNASGTLVETVSGFLRPSYIAVDRSNNVWIAHGYNLCSVYNVSTSQISTWRISTTSPSVTRIYSYSSEDLQNSLNRDEIWGGLAIDIYNRVWGIDSEHNVSVLFKTTNPTDFRIFSVLPPTDTNYIIQPGDSFITNAPAGNLRSAQASGDWTGNRWYQKYSGNSNASPVSGVSTPFTIYDIDSSFQISKVNEEFNCAEYFKSLALPEVLSRNTKVFDELFVGLVGDGNPTKETIGRITYERIANFVGNHADVETAEITELVSTANQLAVDTKTFGVHYPAAINRLLHLFSVPKQRLMGIPSLDSNIEDNVGQYLTRTSLITSDRYYLIEDNKYNTFQLLYVDMNNGRQVYPLTEIVAEGLRHPVIDNYHFYEYNDQNSTGYVGNLIDWNSEYTTISPTMSTYEEWYGDNGLVETMFNNLLTKQLYWQ